jgi:protein phosphatase methylesterase 1
MGGSIATKTLAHIFQQEEKYPILYEKFAGLVVIDVVEGTALDALPFMESIVKSRPTSFKDEKSAISYM